MQNLKGYICFRKFISPYALQYLFWAAICGNFYGIWWLFSHENWAWIVALLFGPLVTRLIFESFILRYQTYVCLDEIRKSLNADK